MKESAEQTDRAGLIVRPRKTGHLVAMRRLRRDDPQMASLNFAVIGAFDSAIGQAIEGNWKIGIVQLAS